MKSPDSPEAFFQRTIRASVAITAVASLLVITYAGPGVALRYFIFSAWMLINLLAWKLGLKEFLGQRRMFAMIPLLTMKIGWIVILIAIASQASLGKSTQNFWAFLLGINTPFLVASLKALGRVLTQTGNQSPCKTSAPLAQVAEKIDSTDE